jgi:hypothetical protein
MSRAYIVTASEAVGNLLKTILPEAVVSDVYFVNGESPYGAESMTSTILTLKRLPVVLIMNANTTNESLIHEQAEELSYLLRQSAAGVPFKLAIAVPEIEVIFFQDRQFVEELAQKQFTDLEWQLIQRHPQELLNILPGGSAAFVKTALCSLNEYRLQLLQQHPLIQEIVRFLSSQVLTLR